MNGPARSIDFSVRPAAGGFAVLAATRPVRTPRGHDLTVPTRALAEAVRAELAETPGVLAGRGLNNPAVAPCFRIAAGAIDILAADADARARLVASLVAYGDTDLVCYRSPRPQVLAVREAAAWDPICGWFADAFAVELVPTTCLASGGQDARLAAVLEAALAALDPFRLAALSLAVHAAGSIVIGLALFRRRVTPEDAFAAAMVGETYQEEIWGVDKEARAGRAVKRLDLEQAARFLALLEDQE